jgi:hypothetical protein
LRFPGKMPVGDRCPCHKGRCPSKGGRYRISTEGDQTVGQK